MPAKSKSQQRLFQMALAVRHGKLKKSEVSNSVLNIVNSEMTDEQIQHFTILKESYLKESYSGYELKFYKSVINKFNLDIYKIKEYLSNVKDITLSFNNETLICDFNDNLFNRWNNYLNKINEIFKILKSKRVPDNALLKFAESVGHEEVYQEVEHIIRECESGYATPMNTLGMGGVNINGGSDLIPQKHTKRTKIKYKRKMKSIKDYIIESLESVDAKDLIYKFYRANIGIENKNENIGDVVEITRKYYSTYDKGFVFGKQEKYNDWSMVMTIKTEDIKSNSALQNYLNKLNKEDEFYKYYLNKNEAENAASKAKQQLTKQHTLESVLKEIKAYKPLLDLGYDYKITTTSQQSKGNKPIECIYVNPTWRIRVENNEIKVDNAGWHTYIVPNVQSLYKVLSTKSTETQRQHYSTIE